MNDPFDDIPECASLDAAVAELTPLARANVMTYAQLFDAIASTRGRPDHAQRRRFEHEGVEYAACYSVIAADSTGRKIHVLSVYPHPPAKVDDVAAEDIARAFLGPKMIASPVPMPYPEMGPKFIRLE